MPGQAALGTYLRGEGCQALRLCLKNRGQVERIPARWPVCNEFGRAFRGVSAASLETTRAQTRVKRGIRIPVIYGACGDCGSGVFDSGLIKRAARRCHGSAGASVKASIVAEISAIPAFQSAPALAT